MIKLPARSRPRASGFQIAQRERVCTQNKCIKYRLSTTLLTLIPIYVYWLAGVLGGCLSFAFTFALRDIIISVHITIWFGACARDRLHTHTHADIAPGAIVSDIDVAVRRVCVITHYR